MRMEAGRCSLVQCLQTECRGVVGVRALVCGNVYCGARRLWGDRGRECKVISIL